LRSTGSQFWGQAGAVSDSPEAGDLFGSSLAAANLASTGHADLAIGAPGEDVGTIGSAGVVHMLRGSASGLTSTSNQLWSQNSSGIADSVEPGDLFGSALAAADFGGSSLADLAIGVPSEDVGTLAGAGSVHVLPGAAAGLTATGSQLWSQNGAVADSPETGDAFGTSLAAANFAGSGQADLAIGVPAENVGSTSDGGSVHLLPGAAGGLTTTGSQIWSQNSSGVSDSVESGDRFGDVLAAANFGGTALADLAVGVPAEDSGAVADTGVVHVLPGSAGGLTGTASQLWSQAGAVADSPESGDGFGGSLAAANFGNSALGDLAIGVPAEDVGTVADAGSVHVLPGATGGLTSTSSKLWSQNSSGVADSAETSDRFGAALGN
jgi:hypothetical protein